MANMMDTMHQQGQEPTEVMICTYHLQDQGAYDTVTVTYKHLLSPGSNASQTHAGSRTGTAFCLYDTPFDSRQRQQPQAAFATAADLLAFQSTG